MFYSTNVFNETKSMNDLNEWGRLSFEKAPSRGRQLSIGYGYEVAALQQKKKNLPDTCLDCFQGEMISVTPALIQRGRTD